MSKFACTDLTSELGMTFISMLFALVIIILTLPFISFFLQHIHGSSLEEDLIVQQFFLFLRDDALQAESINVTANTINFYLDTGEVAQMEQYKDMVRRKVDRKGHEIYIRNIEDLRIDPLQHGMKVTVTTGRGGTYEKTISYYE